MRRVLAALRSQWKTTAAAAGLLLLLIGFFVVKKVRSAPSLPTATAAKKEFVDYVEVHGEIKALHSVTITSPAGVGDLLILKIAATGTKVKKGDTLVEFDTSTLRQKLAQDQSALKSAEVAIEQSVVFGEAEGGTGPYRRPTWLLGSICRVLGWMPANRRSFPAIDGQKAVRKVSDAENNRR